MNYHSICDTLWIDNRFRNLTANSKLVVCAILTCPLSAFTGFFFATVGMLSEYCGIKPAEIEKSLSEIVDMEFIIRCQDFIIIKNYFKHNKFNTKTHPVRLVKDMNALPLEVFSKAMGISYTKDAYLLSCELTKTEPREWQIDCDSQTHVSPAYEVNPSKPVVNQSPTPESEQITRLRGYAQAIFDELGSSKNKPELTTEQYQKLIDKWGFEKLVQLQRVYYEWKATLKKKHTHTDFGTLNKKCWVHEKADEKAKDTGKVDRLNPSGRFLDD